MSRPNLPETACVDVQEQFQPPNLSLLLVIFTIQGLLQFPDILNTTPRLLQLQYFYYSLQSIPVTEIPPVWVGPLSFIPQLCVYVTPYKTIPTVIQQLIFFRECHVLKEILCRWSRQPRVVHSFI